MKIPKSIQLHGQTIKTVYRGDLTESEDCVGLAIYRKCEIVVQSVNGKGQPQRPASLQQQWYCHELVHFILEQMGEDDLRKTEKFVDLFGNLLHQALSTAKY